MLGRLLLSALPLVGSVLAQQQVSYTDASGLPFAGAYDEDVDFTFGFMFPTSTTGNDFIGEFIAPISAKWAGISLGPGMADLPLIVAWPNGNEIVFTTRWAEGLVYPYSWAGPTITTLPYTTINSTHWRWVYHCQNCVSWSSPSAGSIDQTGQDGYGYVTSSKAVDSPSNPNSTFDQHDYASIAPVQLSGAHVSGYQGFLTGGGSSSTKPSSTSPTSTSPSSTSPSSTSTVALPTFSPAYDYIVVGAGYGGLISADRLSQAGKKVLLIERGGPSYGITGGTEQPAWAKGTNYTRFDIPGEFESLFNAANQFWWCSDISSLAGCLIGGGSAINGALYWYPSPEDFSTGNGWPSSWTNIQPYTNMVTSRLPSTNRPSTDNQWYLDQVFTVVGGFLNKAGYSNITINSNVGFKDHAYGQSEFAVSNGLRSGPVVSYLQTSKSRSNFKLVTNTTVTNVVRNGAQISGVRTNQGFYTLTSKGRVILSAGTFGSARILFQSGIGPTDQLQIVQANAKQGPLMPPTSQWINLPVGYNISDNPSVNLVFSQPTINSYNDWATVYSSPPAADAAQYIKNRSGVLASPSPRLNFWRAYNSPDGRTRYAQGTARPGAALPLVPGSATSYNNQTIFTITVYLSQGITSRGRIGITPTLSMTPIVNPWFQDPVDQTVLTQALQDVVTEAKADSSITLVQPDLSQVTIPQFVSSYPVGDLGSNHWVGSASIGHVVDANLKVMNTNNLFVADASIIPALPMGNPHGVIMAAMEKGVANIIALAGGP